MASANSSAANPRRVMAVLAPGLIAYSMGQTVLFAIAGPVFREMGLRESQLGIIISAAAVVFVVSSSVWGRIADVWGRRNTIIFGLSTYGIISLLFAGVMQLGLNAALTSGAIFIGLLLLRLLYAALGAGIQPASVALMADLSDDQARSSAIAAVGAAFGIGMVLGPASAALLAGFGILTPLYAIALLGLGAAVMAGTFLPKEPPREVTGDQQRKLSISPLLPLLGGTLFVYAAMSTIQQTFAFNLQDVLETTSVQAAQLTGYCFMAIAIGTLLMQGAIIQALKPQPQTLLLTGLPIVLMGIAAYSLSGTFVALLASAFVIGCGFGLLTPGLLSAASLQTDEKEQGSVAGFMQATMSSGYVIGPLGGTLAYEFSRTLAAALAVGAIVAGGLLIALWWYQQRHISAGSIQSTGNNE